MESLILLSLTPDPKVWLDQLISLASKNQCTIEESRCTRLGTEWGGTMRIAGNWNAITKMESALLALKEKHPEFWLEFKRTLPLKLIGDHLPYLVQVIGANSPEFLDNIIHFFVEQDIELIDVQTDGFKTNYADTKVATLLMRIQIPTAINISDLRDRFIMLCEEVNVDAILEPEKSIK